MKLKRFNSEGKLSSIRFSCADEVVGEVKNLFFNDQLIEEQILLEIYSPNRKGITKVNHDRLNIDRIFSRKQIEKGFLFAGYRLVDSSKYQDDYSIKTILEIKNEQRRLNLQFNGFYTLMPNGLSKLKGEPLLYTAIGPNTFYLLNDYLLEKKKNSRFNPLTIFNWIKKKISSVMSFKSSN